jgi:hypothetical protein
VTLSQDPEPPSSSAPVGGFAHQQDFCALHFVSRVRASVRAGRPGRRYNDEKRPEHMSKPTHHMKKDTMTHKDNMMKGDKMMKDDAMQK